MRRLLNFCPLSSLSSLAFPIYVLGGQEQEDRRSAEVSRQIKSSRNIKKIEARSLLHHKPGRRRQTHTRVRAGNWNGNRRVVGVGRWLSQVECGQGVWGR